METLCLGEQSLNDSVVTSQVEFQGELLAEETDIPYQSIPDKC